MERRLGRLVGVTALVGVVVAACGDDSDDVTLSDAAVITYHYGDASVPPEFHRSYTLTISQDKVHVVVDSYGEVVGETTEPLPADVWEELVAQVDTITGLDPVDTEQSCSGGTSRSIEIEDGGETVLNVEFEVCDSNDEPADELASYIAPVIDAVPGWDALFAAAGEGD